MNEKQLKQQEIINLMSDLSSELSPCGDWKIIKCYEAKLKGENMPYNLDELLAKRQEIRDRINELQEELKNMPDEV